MDSSKFKAILILTVAAFVAIYLGIAAATAQFEAIGWVIGVLSVVVVLAIGKHIWVFIPITAMVGGGLNFLPGSPFPWWLAAAIAGMMLTLRFSIRAKDTFVFRLTLLDVAIILQVIVISQAFIRNPAGLSVMGGDTVGGKSYISFFLAFIAYAIQAVVKSDMKIFRVVVVSMIVIAVVEGVLVTASQLSPHLASILLPIYSGTDFASAQGVVTDVSVGRLSGSQNLVETLGLAAFTLFIPISTLNPFYPIRFMMMFTSVCLCLLSGFRSVLALLMCYFVTSTIARRRPMDLMLAVMAALVGFAILISTGLTRELPFGAQRILSVISFIDVDNEARYNAEQSPDWRFEMWELALTTDRYIKNKLIGDGFGFSSAELRATEAAAMGDYRLMGRADQIDDMMSRGSYHGFHVETIRFTGVFGLILALVSMGIFFNYAMRMISYYRGRKEWGYVLFVCVPFLIYPFYYMLIFGSYKYEFPVVLVAAGMLKVLENIRFAETGTNFSRVYS